MSVAGDFRFKYQNEGKNKETSCYIAKKLTKHSLTQIKIGLNYFTTERNIIVSCESLTGPTVFLIKKKHVYSGPKQEKNF